MSGAAKPQSRGQAIAEVLVRGSLYGVGATALGAGIGYLRGHGLAGVLDGLNWAGFAMWMLAGLITYGSMGTSGAEMEARSRLGEAIRTDGLPFAPILLALIAGSVCFVVAWLLKNLA